MRELSLLILGIIIGLTLVGCTERSGDLNCPKGYEGCPCESSEECKFGFICINGFCEDPHDESWDGQDADGPGGDINSDTSTDTDTAGSAYFC